MPDRIMPGLGLRAFYDPGQRNWGTPLSDDLRRLSALVQARATSRTTPLPVTGSPGQILIVPADASSHANALALWDQSPSGDPAWIILPPEEGWQIWIVSEAQHIRFTAGAWVPVPRPGVVRLRALAAASHTLEPVDMGCILETTGSSAASVVIPAEVDVPFEVGTLINITQIGSGIATIIAAAGVSLNGVTAGSVALNGQWAAAALTKRGADTWVLQGALAGAVA
jgi:hypothetical protein